MRVTDEMVLAALDESKRQEDLPVEMKACACRGPVPHCFCARQNMRLVIEAALFSANTNGAIDDGMAAN